MAFFRNIVGIGQPGIIIIIIITPRVFFTPALADDLSLDFEWQQVSLILQNSSQYSGQSQQRSSLSLLLFTH